MGGEEEPIDTNPRPSCFICQPPGNPEGLNARGDTSQEGGLVPGNLDGLQSPTDPSQEGTPTNQSIGFVLGYLTTRRACNNIFKGGGRIFI